MSSKRDVFNNGISLIIPTYNCGPYIGDAISCAMSQTLRPYEIIVVDDGSTDNTREIVAGFPGVIYINRAHEGPGSARNAGIEMAECEWVAFLDADDIWDREHLEKVMSANLKNDTVWGFGGMDEFNECGLISPIYRGGIGWLSVLSKSGLFNDFFEAFLRNAPFGTPGLIVKRAILNEVKLFDRTFINHQDWDLFFRIASKYGEVSFVWPSTVKRRLWPKSHSHGKRFNAMLFLNKYFELLRIKESRIGRLKSFFIDYAIIQALEDKDTDIVKYLVRYYPDQLKIKRNIAAAILCLPDSMIDPIRKLAIWANCKVLGLEVRVFDKYF